jgi:predicted nucleotidyltransferase
MPIFEPMFRALNDAGARYVVVGGLAVVLHGHVRLTTDLDLIIDLEPSEARKVLQVLVGLGLRPRAPVNAMDFADPTIRASWIRHKDMRVFTMVDAKARREVDIFTETLLPFAELLARSVEVELGQTRVRVASIPDLILLKRRAGRPIDLADIEVLESILHEKEKRTDG